MLSFRNTIDDEADILTVGFINLLQAMTQANNPLHGITLEKLLTELVEYYGWDELGARINIRCFNDNPSIKSSLKFLRKTEWARVKVENLYLKMKKQH